MPHHLPLRVTESMQPLKLFGFEEPEIPPTNSLLNDVGILDADTDVVTPSTISVTL